MDLEMYYRFYADDMTNTVVHYTCFLAGLPNYSRVS